MGHSAFSLRFALLTILVMGLLAAAVLVTKQQLFKKQAFTSGGSGSGSIYLAPNSGTAAPGETFSVDVRANTSQPVSGLAARLTYPLLASGQPPLLAQLTVAHPELTLANTHFCTTSTDSGCNASCPPGQACLDFALVKNDTTGFISSGAKVANIQFQVGPTTSGSVNLNFDSALTEMYTKSDPPANIANLLGNPIAATYTIISVSSSPTPTPTQPAGSTATLHFSHRLQGIQVQRPDKSFRVLLRQAGLADRVFSVTAQANTQGVYSYAGSAISVPTGTYDVLIKGPVHRQKKFTGVNLTTGTVTKDFTSFALEAGDIAGAATFPFDNYINLLDYGALSSDYDPFTAKNSIADLNFDGRVNLLDYGLLSNNFNPWTKGDE